MYSDLRSWLAAVEKQGELLRLSGASHDLEMSGISEILSRGSKQPMPVVLFDDIPGYPKGYRALFGMLASPRRLAMSLGLPEDEVSRVSLAQNWRNKRRSLKLIPPTSVASGPVQENVMSGKDVDLFRFPSPRFHEFDGGRYFGTAHAVITRDPDTGFVNLGVYRNMLVDRDRLAIHIQPGHDGKRILDKYAAAKQPAPLAIVLGIDPALWFASFNSVAWGISEYDFAGGIRGEPLEVIRGPYTGLPIPANAEIAVEGECHPGEMADEGPFGEWHGYYANQGLEKVPEPVVRVKTVMHRNAPIFTGVQLAKPPHEYTLSRCLSQTGNVWDALDGCGVSGIAGVWCHEAGAGSLLTVISLHALYSGHARQAALIASQIPTSTGRYTVVVDDDIDPSDLNEVMWAVCTRSDPERAIEILRYCRSASSDPAIPVQRKREDKVHFASRAIIDACWPYESKDESYPVARLSPGLRASLLTKWETALKEWL